MSRAGTRHELRSCSKRGSVDIFASTRRSSSLKRSGPARKPTTGLPEFREVHVQLCVLAEILVILGGRDLPALIPANPPLVPEQVFELVPRNRAGSMQSLNPGLEIEIDQHLAEIEEQCSNLHS